MSGQHVSRQDERHRRLVQAITSKFPRPTERIVLARADAVVVKNPWEISTVRFGMTKSERDHPRTRDQLEEEGGILRGSRIVNGDTTYLPVFDDSMIGQYNHRWRILSTLRQAHLEHDMSPELAEMPHRWIEDRHVIQAVANLPEDLARYFYHGAERDRDRVLAYWLAGYHLNRGDAEAGRKILLGLLNPMMSIHDAMSNYLGTEIGESAVPLSAEEVAYMHQFSDWQEWGEYLIKRRTPTWMIAVREIGQDEECRHIAAAVLPLAGLDSSLTAVLLPRFGAGEAACYLANLTCHVLRFVLKAGEASTNGRVDFKKKLPSVPPSGYGEELKRFILARVLELAYTAWDLAPFAEACGFQGPAFRWGERRRFLIRCELETQYFHLYGVERDDVDYIMGTLTALKQQDEAAHGHYRSKATILEIYDEMAEAKGSGRPYITLLDPPPGSPADERGNFLPLPEWYPGQPQPKDWPPHIHPPEDCV